MTEVSWMRLLGCSVAVSGMLATAASGAVVLNVDSFLDAVDDDPNDGICHTAANTCTLRAAVMQANKIGGTGVTIVLAAGTYTLTRPVLGGNGDDSGDLNLTTPAVGSPTISIVGTGATRTIIDGNGIDRVFRIHPNRVATISAVNVRNGITDGSGGGIFNEGTLTLSDSAVSDNLALLSGAGGGLSNIGALTLLRCRVSGNGAFFGGGIVSSGPLVVTQSTISGNLAGNSALGGGGIYSSGNLNMTDSTISWNSSQIDGGGLDNNGLAFLTNTTIGHNQSNRWGGGVINRATLWTYNVTIAFNGADADGNAGVDQGGGVYNAGPSTLALRNSVVAFNTTYAHTHGDDCKGPIGTYGRNAFAVTNSGCQLTHYGAGGDIYIGFPGELGPLQFNGGPTETFALIAPSTMIDGGEPIYGCVDKTGFALNSEQRGGARPVGPYCDLGAYEDQALPTGLLFADGFESGGLFAWR